jgi:hypothetical protein
MENKPYTRIKIIPSQIGFMHPPFARSRISGTVEFSNATAVPKLKLSVSKGQDRWFDGILAME